MKHSIEVSIKYSFSRRRRQGVHNSGVWGLKRANGVLPRVRLGRGPPRGGVHNSGVWGLKRANSVLPRARVRGEARRAGEYAILEFGA